MDPFDIPPHALTRTLIDMVASKSLAADLSRTEPSQAGWLISITGSVHTEICHSQFLGVTALVVALGPQLFLLTRNDRVQICASLAECQGFLDEDGKS